MYLHSTTGKDTFVNVLILVLCLLALAPAVHADNAIEARVQRHVAEAKKGGLQPDDFHHLVFSTVWRSTVPRWELVAETIAGFADASPMDPLMADELRLMQALRAVDEGRYDNAREYYRIMGGLTRWWAAGPVFIDELEDFPAVAVLPAEGPSWRPAQGTDPLGWVHLSGLAWPARRQMLYLSTTVNSRRTQEVALRLGVSQSARVWLNGNEVMTTPRPLSRAEDQSVAGGWLEEGDNSLVVAVASENDDWWLRLRLTSPEGTRLEGVRELDREPQRRSAPARPAPSVRSLEQELRSAVDHGRDEARLALAAYLVTRRPQPVTASDAQVACREARAVDPAEARLLEWLITSEPTAARTLLEEALAADPELQWARVELLRWYHQRELYAAAERVADGGGGDPFVRAVALDLDAVRWGPLVIPELEAIAAAWPRSPELTAILAARAMDGARWPTARAALSRLDELTPGLTATVRLRQELAAHCGDSDTLVAMLRRELAEDANLPELRVRLARVLAARDEPEQAREILDEGLRRCPDHGEILIELARLEHAGGDDERAAALARRMLELRPQDRRAERLLELLGDSAPAEHWIRGEKELRALAAEAREASPAVGLVNHVELHFLPSRLTEEKVQRAFLVTDAERADLLRAHPLPYVPERQRLRVLRARVLRADGSELAATQSDTPRLSEPEINIYYDTRLRMLRFPELENGDLVDIAYVLSETAEANETGPYKGGLLRLGQPFPMALVEVQMQGPQEYLPQWETVHLQGDPERHESADGSVRLQWTWHDVPATARDIPPAPDLLVTPHLIYSNHPTWGELGQWYSKHVAPRIRPSRLVEQTANELVEGVDDRLQRIARIYRFVTDDIRYVGLEFGEHRFRPFPADWVLNHRIGDCKDKAALLVALLGAVDIPASMVMVRIADEGPVPSSIAVLEVFNHAIAYLPEDDLWLDGTATGHAPYPPPTMDQGAWVMVVEGGDNAPRTTPMPGGGISRFEYRLARRDANQLELNITTTDTGEAADNRRAMFAGTNDPRRYASWLQSQFPGADLVGEPEVTMRPGRRAAVMKLNATVTRTAVLSRGGLPVFPGEFDWAAQLVPTGKRSGPLLLPVRPRLEWTLEVQLEGGPSELPEDSRLSSDFGQLELKFLRRDTGYEVQGSFELEPQMIQAQQAPALREFLLAVQQRLSETLEVP